MAVDISIIIPSKNRLWSLPKAVESCRSSRLKMQIIVIDDASTDGTTDWLRTQPDVTIVQGEGWGKPSGVNRALPLVEGKYLRYLDSDDWLAPGVNEEQFALAERDGADVVVTGLHIYVDDTFKETQPWIPTDDFIAQQLGETAGSHYSSFLFRSEFVKDIPHREYPTTDSAARDDRCYVLEVAVRHPKLSVSPTPALCHRHHTRGRLQFQSGLRSTIAQIQHVHIYRQILRMLEAQGDLTPRRKKAAARNLWYVAHWLSYSHLNDSFQVADKVFELDPEFQVPEKGLVGLLYRNLGFRNTERILTARRNAFGFFRQIGQALSSDPPVVKPVSRKK